MDFPDALICEVSLWSIAADGALRWRQGCGPAGHAYQPALPHPALPAGEGAWAQPALAPGQPGSVAARVSLRDGDTVLVLGVAADAGEAAAIEVWQRTGAPQLQPVGTWYSGPARAMADWTRHLRIPLGAGLPGMALEMGAPVYLGELDRSEIFLRSRGAAGTGLCHGLALPSWGGRAAALLMSHAGRPLARCLALMADHDGARCLAGYSTQQGDLFDAPKAAAPWQDTIDLHALGIDAPYLLLRDEPGAASLLDPQQAQALLVWPFAQGREVARTLLMWI